MLNCSDVAAVVDDIYARGSNVRRARELLLPCNVRIFSFNFVVDKELGKELTERLDNRINSLYSYRDFVCGF